MCDLRLPKIPQDLLPLLAINLLQCKSWFPSAQLTFTTTRTYHQVLPRGFVQNPLNLPNVFIQVHSNL